MRAGSPRRAASACCSRSSRRCSTQLIPANLRDPDGLWYGLAKRARVLVYAKDRVDPAQLSTYEALADPAFKGKVARPQQHQRLQSEPGRLDPGG